MSRPTRLFSVAAANKLVPLLQATFERVRSQREEMKLHVQELRAMGYDFSGEPDDLSFPEGSDAEKRFRRCSEVHEEILRSVNELVELGVEVKGLDGLVDVRSQYDDRVVYLCWREGEAAFLFWHELDGGFAGRYPITDPDLFEGTLLN